MRGRSATILDEAGAVRAGEELDREALTRWLAERAPELMGAGVEVTQFPAGHSNLTYLVRVGEGERARELVLRRPPFGSKVKSAHDMGREFTILRALAGRFPVPRPLWHEADAAVLGAPFYTMERVVGVIPRKKLGVPDAHAGTYARLSEALVRTMAALHAVDWRAAGLEGLYRGPGYARRQVEGWARRWEDARTEEVASVEALKRELLGDVPEDDGATIVHNDLKYDNLVLDPGDVGHVRAVLDWEMATVGCPLMDLGTSLGYWVEAGDPPAVRMLAFVPTTEPGNLDREGVVRRYEELTGRVVTRPVFYFVFGVFKLAVVGQQIYQRFVTGKTQDKRFAIFGPAVRTLGELGVRALDLGRLSRLGG